MRTADRGSWIAGLLAAGLALAACQPPPGQCSNSAACPPNSICVANVCRLACNSSDVCAAGEFCRDGYCAPGAPRDGGDGEAGNRFDAAEADRLLTDAARPDHAALPDRAGVDQLAVPDVGALDGVASDVATADGSAQDHAASDRPPADQPVVDSAPIDSNQPMCGDGEVNVYGEQCDDHNRVTESCDYGLQSCQVCDESCQWAAGAVSYCGDGQVDPNFERCDGSWDCTSECALCSNPAAYDQQLLECTSPPVTQCTDSFVVYSGQSAAQSFTAGMSGALTSVWLYGRNQAFATNPVQVAIVDALASHDSLLDPGFEITAHTLASAQASWADTADWYELAFSPPAIVSTGNIYYLVMRLVGDLEPECPPVCWDDVQQLCMCSANAYWGLYNFWQAPALDSYQGGYAFACGSGCPSWSKEPSYRDQEFRVMITPLCR